MHRLGKFLQNGALKEIKCVLFFFFNFSHLITQILQFTLYMLTLERLWCFPWQNGVQTPQSPPSAASWTAGALLSFPSGKKKKDQETACGSVE